MADPNLPCVIFVTGNDVEDAPHPSSSPEDAMYVLEEAVRRIHPSLSSVSDRATTVLFGPSLRRVVLSVGEERLHITAYDGTDAPPRDQTLVTEWKDLADLLGVASRLAGFLHPGA